MAFTPVKLQVNYFHQNNIYKKSKLNKNRSLEFYVLKNGSL